MILTLILPVRGFFSYSRDQTTPSQTVKAVADTLVALVAAVTINREQMQFTHLRWSLDGV